MESIYTPIESELQNYIRRFYLVPELWNKFNLSELQNIDFSKWQVAKMLDNDGNLSPETNKIPTKYGGIYVYTISPPVIPDCGTYIMYIGMASKTDSQNLRYRVRSYKTQFGEDYTRDRIHNLFSRWGEYVYVHYLPVDADRAKPVGADENIALDEDDINAIITRELVQSFPLYMGKNVSLYSGKHISRANKDAFTSLITLYQCVEIIIKHSLKKENIINKKYKEYLLYRPNDEKISEMKSMVFSIMESFVNNTTVVKKYVDIDTEGKALGFRNSDGGNLLFRPAALTEYFNAVLVLVDTGHTYDEAFSLLDKVPQELKDTPWKGFLWDGSNIIARASKPTIKNLLVFMSQRDALTESEYNKMLTQYSSSINTDIAQTEMMLKELLTEY